MSKSLEVRSSKFKVQSPGISAARLAAFEILQKIEREKAFSSILLPAYEENLLPEDRALCHEITLGVLRNQTLLDAHLAHVSGKKPEKFDLAVRLALRIGLYQLKFLTRIPPRAAVNESVNLVYRAKKRSAAGFVNAVLRKCERDEDFDPLAAIKDPLERLAIETSHPVWLIAKWQQNFGFDETAALARANNCAPPTAFRITAKNTENVLSELQTANAVLNKSLIVPDAWRISGAGGAKLRELGAAASVYLQDEASQLVAHVCDVSGDQSFLDVCAAPGGKASLIAALQTQIHNPSSDIRKLFVAGDFTAPRIKILRDTINKYSPGKIELVRYDAMRSLPFAEQGFACILVDAPCTGTGTIRHNPEIRWHLQAADFARLAEKQLQILSNAAQLVKVGGRLIYSTCSLEPEEGETVVALFLAQNADFTAAKINLPERFASGEYAVRTFPQRDDTDGFFLCLLQRTK